MNALHRLLTELRDEVLESFDQTIRSSEGIESMRRSEIRDGLPDFLDLLLAPDAAGLLGAGTAREHGRQRFQLGFSAQDVVYEYGVLLEVLHDVAERHLLLLSREEARFLDRVFFEASYRAVAEFASQQERARTEQAGKHLSFLAHDLRDALNTAQLALTVIRNQPVHATRALAAIERGLDRIHGMLQRTLVAGWLNARVAVNPEEIRVQELLEGVVNELSLEIEQREQRVVIDVDAPHALIGDRDMLASTLTNLLRNAFKFSPAPCDIVLRARASVEERVQIEVEDCCGGLPPDQLEKIFEPFVQASRDRTGFGLGLAIARRAAEAHGGMLTVRNLPGKGCLFVLDLPVAPL